MLTIQSPRKNHLELTLSGRLSASAMAEALDAFLELSRDMSHGTMLYTITDFEIPELGAIAVELRRMPALLRTIFVFDRCAVLCETPWIKTVAELRRPSYSRSRHQGLCVDRTRRCRGLAPGILSPARGGLGRVEGVELRRQLLSRVCHDSFELGHAPLQLLKLREKGFLIARSALGPGFKPVADRACDHGDGHDQKDHGEYIHCAPLPYSPEGKKP
jgi:hypothetical protein